MKIRPMALPLMVLVSLLVSGCAKNEPFAYHDASQIPEGAGLFSGEDGAFGYQFESMRQSDSNHSDKE